MTELAPSIEAPLPDQALVDLVPLSVAEEYCIVPIKLIGTSLVFAGTRRLREKELERLEFILNRRVRCIVVPKDWYEPAAALLRANSKDLSNSAVAGSYSYRGGSYHWDGDTLVAHVRGSEGSSFWTGLEYFPPDHEERNLMRWILESKHFQRRIDQSEIPQIRRIWQQWRKRVLDKSDY